MVKITSCDCKNEQQDEMYGKKQRLHNIGGTSAAPKYKCSVCGIKK